eukprot:TRINITY_DN11114_c0_g1_i1.p1 TRINITY_DN11114_c0_g1~~TRINITY_DN11114_c0_g1_i1.p1  ORF type:complete len:150 (+),score=7.97 TRINITY_DN11114_c0_g1_i1:43-450(+)
MGAGFSQNDEPLADVNTTGRLPWKMGTVDRTVHGYKHYRGAQPCELQHPALKHCRETRMYRDQCINTHGACEYKIEAHFQCLEQFYPKEKVTKLRKAFRNQGFDNYDVIDNLVVRAPYYYQTDYLHNYWNPLTTH